MLWQEKILPILALEVISKKYNGEYDRKLLQYQDLGILYYVVYNALSGRRGIYKKHQSLEVYKLMNGKYELIPSVSLLQKDGKMVWMPEVGLGIGCELSNRGNWEREWVYWYDRNSVRYPTAEERAETAEERAETAEMIAEQERQQKLQERQQKEKLATYLKSLGINPDEI